MVIPVRVSDETLADLQALAEEVGVSLRQAAAQAIENGLVPRYVSAAGVSFGRDPLHQWHTTSMILTVRQALQQDVPRSKSINRP